MSIMLSRSIIKNVFHFFFLVAIITAALSLGSVSGADGFIARATGTTTTKAATPPAVSTAAASTITESAATLNGDLKSLGTATTVNVSFEYGYTNEYGKNTPPQAMTATGTFSADITGLLPNMEWHFRAKAVGESIVYGDNITFSTSSVGVGAAKAAFISNRDGNDEVYAITADGLISARLTNNTAQEAWPRYFFNNYNFSKITFTSWRDGNAEVYVMYPDGTGQTRLTNNANFDGMSDFSWDGTKIAFVSDRDGNYEIYVMNVDGSGQTRLTTDDAADIMPAFSPDGTRIAFASNRDGDYEIYVMNLTNGNSITQLTNNIVEDNYPSWLSNGTKISFSTIRDGNSEIYTMDDDGANQINLTNNSANDDQPYWCPTGNAIIFTSWRDTNTPQVWFKGAQEPYLGALAPFTNKSQGSNWSRANWAAPGSSTTPVVVTGTASNITTTGATVSGGLTGKGSADSVTVSFEYGTTTSYGNTEVGIPPTLDSAGAFTADLTGLTPDQTYHFRTIAVGDGTVHGNDATFTTTSLSADFKFTGVNITPSTPQIGDTVNITVTCTNIGGSPGTYPVILKINGVSEQTEEVSLDPDKSQLVTFTVTESKSGTYEVNVNELTGSFVVQKSNKSHWPLVAEIVGGAIAFGLVVLIIFRRRVF